jgi:hypothetical protein
VGWAFCQHTLQQLADTPIFRTKVLFTDELCFTRTGINICNEHVWLDENPHAIKSLHHQGQFSINSINHGVGILGDCPVSPHILLA